MKKYDVWTQKNGSMIAVSEMADNHLLNTVKAIEEYRRLSKPNSSVSNLVFENWKKDREAWLTVLRGEILKRGLAKTTETKVGLLEWLLSETGNGHMDHMLTSMRRVLEKSGIAEPQIDIDSDMKPIRQHWINGEQEVVPLPF